MGLLPWKKKKGLDDAAPQDFQDAWRDLLSPDPSLKIFKYDFRSDKDDVWLRISCSYKNCGKPITQYFVIAMVGASDEITAIAFACPDHFSRIRENLTRITK